MTAAPRRKQRPPFSFRTFSILTSLFPFKKITLGIGIPPRKALCEHWVRDLFRARAFVKPVNATTIKGFCAMVRNRLGAVRLRRVIAFGPSNCL